MDSLIVDPFTEAARELLGDEGWYAFDADDAGGETFMGISRVYHPDWAGWVLVDRKWECGLLNGESKILLGAVYDFYKTNYWHRFNGDALAELSMPVAKFVFSWAVNKNVTRAVEDLQEALNLLNRNQVLYKDILVDGVLGPVTLKTLKRCLVSKTNRKVFLIILHTIRNTFYINKMKKYPSQEKWVGWFLRGVPKEIQSLLPE